MRDLPPPNILEQLTAAADANQLVVIEIERDGQKLYANGISIFGPKPSANPADAKNYAEDRSWSQLWYDVRVLYVADQGGGKSALRTDIPGKIAIFGRPSIPSLIARINAE